MVVRFKCYMAPSLGGLEATPAEAWGTEPYKIFKDRNEPTVFVGLYDLRDYLVLYQHRGEKYVLWCSGDIDNLLAGFVLNDGKLQLISKIFKGLPSSFMDMLRYECSHYVEDDDEAEKLKSLGIRARVAPSFLGKIEDFPISYKQRQRPNVYLSGHPDREEEYGFFFVEELAKELPDVNFHLYGAEYCSSFPNLISHGIVPKSLFNADIKSFQCGLRLNKSDGFSEITAKSVLMGQYPITYLTYPLIPSFKKKEELVELLSALKEMDKPNFLARDYYLLHLNSFPWVRK